MAGVLASVALAAPAAAFTAPELFVREQTWNTHEAASGWIPLASAPVLNYLAGFQIGYKLQASGQPNEFQRVALTIAAVPDGRPTQPYAAPPFCVGRAGTVGTIVEAGPELQFEGDGTYRVTVSVGLDSSGPAGCLSGPSTTASFSVPTRVVPTLVGDPMTFRVTPLAGKPFVGVRAAAPPGGDADVRCALNATVRPDGSVAGSVVVPDPDFSHATVPEFSFSRPGPWTCVARGTVEGIDESFDTAVFATPWSGPLRVAVRSDFRRRTGRISHPRSKRPRFTFTAEWPELANGGRGSVTLSRVKGCKDKRFKLRKVATYSGRFDAAHMRVTMRRPRAGYYIGRFTFAGTPFLRASVDPNPMLLVALRRRVGFVDPRGFARCPGFS